MSLYGLWIFAAIYFLAVALPGPGIAAVVARALARGTQGAPAFIAGFLVGDLIWFTFAATGLAALARLPMHCS
jgi:threonine/homoserine/homoserine lactone efflux protein